MSRSPRLASRRPILPPRPMKETSQHSALPAYQETWPPELPLGTESYESSSVLMPLTDEVSREVLDNRLSHILTLIDEDAFHGSAADLIIDLPTSRPNHDIVTARSADHHQQSTANSKSVARNQNRSINILAKISFYSNSRLPANLPPLRVYIPTWPLLCLAAQYSSSAYEQPSETLATCIPTDSRLGTRATIVKAVCCDDRRTIVFAIRGTSTFSLNDWNANFNHKPTSPAGFLDDAGNLCHSGFLRIARAMIKPIATHLRTLLEQNPSRAACSLLITGHSAGGAVASLIYSHMLSQALESELTILTACFKRVHCVTFGAPPISLLPLSKPPTSEARLRKCLFHSFINEGDPVARAEPVFVRSLLDLLMTPLPTHPSSSTSPSSKLNSLSAVCANLGRLELNLLPGKRPKKKNDDNNQQSQVAPATPPPAHHTMPQWRVPPSTLSNAGRLIVLRVPPLPSHPRKFSSAQQRHQHETSHEFRAVTASVVSDEQIRQVVFGDLLVHNMEVYRRRIEALGFRVVTAKD